MSRSNRMTTGLNQNLTNFIFIQSNFHSSNRSTEGPTIELFFEINYCVCHINRIFLVNKTIGDHLYCNNLVGRIRANFLL